MINRQKHTNDQGDTMPKRTSKDGAKGELRRKHRDPDRRVQRLAVVLPDGVEQEVMDLIPESCYATATQKRGRPSCYIPRVVKAILMNLVRCHALSHAALLAGVSPAVVHSWMNKDEAFMTAVVRAQAMAVDLKLRNLEEVKDERERARVSMWLLERRFPRDFGPTKTLRVETDDVSSRFGPNFFLRLSQARLEYEAQQGHRPYLEAQTENVVDTEAVRIEDRQTDSSSMTP